MEIEIESLAGREYWLSGWDRLGDKARDPEVQWLRLRLSEAKDGARQVYVFTEDPADGYRSSLDSVVALDTDDIATPFEPVRVTTRWVDSEKTSYGTAEAAELLEFRSAQTGEVIAEVGTANTHDYYPYFVAEVYPEALTRATLLTR